MEATEHTGFQAETLRGDVRDKFMDDVVRRMPGWTQMREHEQRAVISTVNSVACLVIRRVAEVIADRGFTHMQVSTGEFTVKDGIKMKVSASFNVENVNKLAEHGGGEAILVFADTSAFFGQRAEASFDKDEPELPIEGQPGHDPETGELLDGHRGEASDDAEDLPETSDLPEPPADDEDADEGDPDADDVPEDEVAAAEERAAREAEAAPSRRRRRTPADAHA